MKRDTRVPIARSDYRPPDFEIPSIDLEIELSPSLTMVAARLEISRRGTAPLVLDGRDLELRRIRLDQKDLAPADYRLDEEHLTIFDVGDRAHLEIVTAIHPERNTALEGLYLSRGLFCTQCEAEGFRKITYCLDRPDVLSRYRVKLVADRDACPILLSNGDCVARGPLPDGRHFAEWHDPHLKPCYLFAAVAGRLEPLTDHFRTASGRDVRLAIWTEPGDSRHCHYAMDSLKRAMAWDEAVFGLEYDGNEFNIVAVHNFNMGAMENKSLNIFNAQYILSDPDIATDRDYAGIEAVVGHEYFHNWTGNRVTCRDWFELCLKEGLTVFREQEFAGDQRSRALRRIEDVRMLRSRQFPEDAGPLAHPVRPESYIEISNFYTATIYEKGAEIIRMLMALIGRDAFFAGHRLYIERHDGTAARVDDFLNAMQDASGRDLTAFARWYSDIGTPEIVAKSTYDATTGQLELALTQNCRTGQSPRVIPIAVGLLDEQGCDLVSETLILEDSTQTFHFSDLPQCPQISWNCGFSAPVKFHGGLDDEALIFLYGRDPDPFARYEAGQDLCLRHLLAAVEDPGRTPAARLLDAFRQVLLDERLDPAFAAEALTISSERLIADQMATVDVAGIHRARETLNAAIGTHCAAELRSIERPTGAFSAEARAAGQRAMANLALALRAASGESGWPALALNQFRTANNMTDRIAALTLLCRYELSEREIALAEFEARFSGQPLAVYKWLAAQATSPLPGTLENVRRLSLHHPSFNLKTPNAVRALIGNFASGNPLRFHAADGSAYRFLSEFVRQLDPINSQIAARIVEPLCQWRRQPRAAGQLMRDELQRILALDALSRDSYEVVSKALAP